MNFGTPARRDYNSKIKNWDGAAFAEALRSSAEVGKMQVGRVGYVSPSAIVSTKDGELYINGRFALSDSSPVATIEIKRVSKNAFEVDFLNVKKEDYKSILKFSDLEEASGWFFDVKSEDFINVGNIKASTIPRKVNKEDKTGIPR